MPDPFALSELPNTRPTHTPDGHRIAVCRPMNHRQQWEDVELLARVGKGLVRVHVIGSDRFFACPPWRLSYPTSRRRELTRTDVADLPWEGSGPDPLLEEQPAIAGVKR